jgi:beta-lactamase regulating signal transducer with metallopeptidase domain
MMAATTQAINVFLITLGSAAVRSISLAILAAAALAAFRTKSVRVKLFVWKGLLFAALAMPALILVSPAIRISVPLPNLPKRSVVAPAVSMPLVVARAAVRVPFEQAIPDDLTASPGRARPAGLSEPAPTLTAPKSLPLVLASVPARREIPWTIVIGAAYLAVALAFLARLLIGVSFSSRLVRSSKPIDEIWALRALLVASRAAGLRSPPRLAESEAVSVPLMLGVLEPTILLTPGWRDWGAGELAAVLAHEASHVTRRDALAQRLALIHRAIFWFNPLAWWLERHLADLAEQASDEAALAGGMDRTRYAEALLGFFAELEAGEKRVWWQGVSMAKAGQAEKRVDRILAWRGAMSNKLTKSLAVALMLVAAPVVALTAAVRPAAYDVQAPAAPAAPPAPQQDSNAPAPPQNAEPSPAPAPAPGPDAMPASPPDSQNSGPEIRIVVPPLPPMPPLHVDLPPIQVPEVHIQTRLLPMQQDGVVEPPMTFSTSGDWNFYRGMHGGYWVGRYSDWGPRFAIVSKDSDELTLSGDRDDAEHARALKKKIAGDFIWFERDEKSYIISDPVTVNRAKQLWQPGEDLEKQQKDLGKQQEDLAKQAEDAEKKIEDMKIKLPDLTAEMQKVEEAMRKLNTEGGTLNEIGDLQSQMGEIQREIGEVESSVGRTAGQFGREQGEWGRKMGEIGRKQGELGRKQAELAREASRQMRELLDDAVAKGLAKPE